MHSYMNYTPCKLAVIEHILCCLCYNCFLVWCKHVRLALPFDCASKWLHDARDKATADMCLEQDLKDLTPSRPLWTCAWNRISRILHPRGHMSSQHFARTSACMEDARAVLIKVQLMAVSWSVRGSTGSHTEGVCPPTFVTLAATDTIKSWYTSVVNQQLWRAPSRLHTTPVASFQSQLITRASYKTQPSSTDAYVVTIELGARGVSNNTR